MYFDDIKQGTEISLDDVVIEKEEMLSFAKRYDNVPIHTDEEYAKTTPFGKLIAPGVMSFMAVWAKYLEKDLFGEELLAGKSTKIEWLRPVFAGDVLSSTARVSGLTPRNAKNGIVELTIEVKNGEGTVVLVNTTEAIVKRRI